MSNIYIHNTSIVDEGAAIGNGTKVWHFCHISAGAQIGKNCSFGQNVYVANDVIIGNNCKIQNNVSIYDAVRLEDDVFCGPSMVFTNVINPRSSIERKNEYKQSLVKKGASIGANATIICGNEIGMYALIGAGALINQAVKDYAVMVGVPAKQIGWVSRYGLNLNLPTQGNGEAICPETKEKYVLEDGKLYEL